VGQVRNNYALKYVCGLSAAQSRLAVRPASGRFVAQRCKIKLRCISIRLNYDIFVISTKHHIIITIDFIFVLMSKIFTEIDRYIKSLHIIANTYDAL